jgi:hypothetical protein
MGTGLINLLSTQHHHLISSLVHQFAKRDSVYFGSPAVRQTDSFVVICTITSSPVPPTNPPRFKKRLVPSAMLDVIGSLLDDPTYSDVEFVFPNKRPSKRAVGPHPKKIWASKKLLMRAEYFEASKLFKFLKDCMTETYSTY